MEAERKIIVRGEDCEERVKYALKMLEENYGALVNRENYERTMVYMDTFDKKLQKENRIFRLTQEKEDVKATMHIDNHLQGDRKQILKFFFTKTEMPTVVNFFREALSLSPITKEIKSVRTEYKSSFGEVAVDEIQDENTKYYCIELELDKFMDESRDSSKVDKVAQSIALNLGLNDCDIVDLGTEAIYEKVTGRDYFEINSNRKGIQK